MMLSDNKRNDIIKNSTKQRCRTRTFD